MGIINVPSNSIARSLHVQQIINWLRGNPSFSEPVSLTGIASNSSFALSAGNTGTGGAFRALNRGLTIPILKVTDDGVEIRPLAEGSVFRIRDVANGSNVFEVTTTGVTFGGVGFVTTTGTQTLTNKTLTAPLLSEPKITTYAEIVQQSSAPSTPGALVLRLYARTASEELHIKGPSTGVEKTLVDTDTVQTLSGKSFTGLINSGGLSLADYIEFTQVATPSAPVAGKMRFYSKSGSDLIHYRSNTSGEKVVVDLDTAQSMSGKTLISSVLSGSTLTGDRITDYVDITNNAAPGSPSAGGVRLTSRSDNLLYITTSGGVSTAVVTVTTNLPSIARTMAFGGL